MFVCGPSTWNLSPREPKSIKKTTRCLTGRNCKHATQPMHWSCVVLIHHAVEMSLMNVHLIGKQLTEGRKMHDANKHAKLTFLGKKPFGIAESHQKKNNQKRQYLADAIRAFVQLWRSLVHGFQVVVHFIPEQTTFESQVKQRSETCSENECTKSDVNFFSLCSWTFSNQSCGFTPGQYQIKG